MDPDPQRAHGEEIFEGLIDAIQNGDIQAFEKLNAEWERIDHPEDGKLAIRFAGGPRYYTCLATCPHCDFSWRASGVLFLPEGEDDILAEMLQQMHLFDSCEAADDCICWVDDEDGDESWERCQQCYRADIDCECADGPMVGPCLSMSAVIVWEDP